LMLVPKDQVFYSLSNIKQCNFLSRNSLFLFSYRLLLRLHCISNRVVAIIQLYVWVNDWGCVDTLYCSLSHGLGSNYLVSLLNSYRKFCSFQVTQASNILLKQIVISPPTSLNSVSSIPVVQLTSQ